MNLNTQFVFDGKLKRNLYIGMAFGFLCLLLSLVGDDEYNTRFWTNYLHNSVYFTGIAFTAMFFMCAQITAFAGWMVAVKRVWEAMSQFMLVGLFLLLVVTAGVWGIIPHFELYHWTTDGLTDPNSPLYDRIIAGKSGFLSPFFYTIGVIGFLAIWYFWAYKLRQNSLLQDEHETPAFDYYKKERKWAASFLPLGGFLSTVFLWEAIMSIDPHWYSTMFAWYSTISMLLGGLSLMIMVIIYLQSKGYLEYVTRDHLHDLGKYLFGISVFWTYLWFDQFMLIWYANVGEETIYFKERMNEYPVLFWGNLLLNFVTPFLILMRNDTKRKYGTLFFVSIIVFFGHWWDFFYMIKPGARIAAYEAKEISEGKHHSSLGEGLKDLGQGLKEVGTAVKEVGQAAQEIGNAASEASKALAPEHPQDTATAHSEAAAAETNDTHAADTHAAEASAATSGGGHAEAGHGDGGHGDEHGAAAHHGPSGFKMGFTIPGLQEIGAMIGFLSLFLFFFYRHLERAPLVPLKDPFLEESLHHSTGVYDEDEDGHGGHDDHGHGH